MEIVTEPDIHSADAAREYLQALRRTLVYIGVSDCRMEQGSMRCEPNISVRPAGTDELNAKTELKNLNSFRVVYLGILYETARQGLGLQKERGLDLGVKPVVAGQPPLRVDLNDLGLTQETRRWDEAGLKTASMRTKEYAHDYRYFPEPDLAPLDLDPAWSEQLRRDLLVLPEARLHRYVHEMGLSEYDAGVLVDERETSDYFDAAVAAFAGDPKKVANWLQSDWMRLFNAAGRDWGQVRVTAESLAELLRLQEEGKITGPLAKSIFETMWETGKSAATIVLEQGIEVVGDESKLLGMIDEVIAANPKVIADIQKGQIGKVNFLVGQVMRASRGSAKPDVVQRLTRERLNLPG
jgi:aspartyl-tRNA(Asn)/glutamyl-tRNA(Gln) amidotransferase subunit B